MIRHTVRSACSLVAAVLVPATALAHPGHGVGGGDWSFHHYLTEPDHVLSGLALLLVVAMIWRLVRAANRAHSAAANAKDPR
jgi:hydrogenase/urease accessory protein HupE